MSRLPTVMLLMVIPAYCGAGTSWYDTNEKEMHFFFGVQIMMGIKQQPEYRDCWLQDPETTTSVLRFHGIDMISCQSRHDRPSY